MVRIKHRYLLVNILYPEPLYSTTTSITTSGTSSDTQNLPAIVRFRKPTPDAITTALLIREIRDQIALLYGDYGAGATSGSLSIKYFSNATSTFILRCPRAQLRLVWAALSLMTHLGAAATAAKRALAASSPSAVTVGGAGLACVMRVVRVSGTIRKVEEEAVRRARVEISKAQGKWEDKGSDAEVESGDGEGKKDFGSLLDMLLKGGSGGDAGVGKGGMGVEDDDDDDDEEDEDVEMDYE